MKKIFEHMDYHIVGHYRSVLAAEGIPTQIRNANASGIMGELPFVEVFPELWLFDDADEPRAREILRELLDHDVKGVTEPWTCSHCGETVEPPLAECWNCGRPL